MPLSHRHTVAGRHIPEPTADQVPHRRNLDGGYRIQAQIRSSAPIGADQSPCHEPRSVAAGLARQQRAAAAFQPFKPQRSIGQSQQPGPRRSSPQACGPSTVFHRQPAAAAARRAAPEQAARANKKATPQGGFLICSAVQQFLYKRIAA